VGYAQALGQQKFQLIAKPLAPIGEVQALVREAVLEELFPGEVLEIGVVDPALAHALVGQGVDVLEQQQPEHEAGLNPRPPLVATERRDVAIEPIPIHLAPVGEENRRAATQMARLRVLILCPAAIADLLHGVAPIGRGLVSPTARAAACRSATSGQPYPWIVRSDRDAEPLLCLCGGTRLRPGLP
jgi:hypothetical protein